MSVPSPFEAEIIETLARIEAKLDREDEGPST